MVVGGQGGVGEEKYTCSQKFTRKLKNNHGMIPGASGTHVHTQCLAFPTRAFSFNTSFIPVL